MAPFIFLFLMTVSVSRGCDMNWRMEPKAAVLDPRDIFEGKFDVYWSRLVFSPGCVDRIVVKMNDETVHDNRTPNKYIRFQEKIQVNSIVSECETAMISIQLTDGSNVIKVYTETIDPLIEFFDKEWTAGFQPNNSSVNINWENGRFQNEDFKRFCFESVDIEINGETMKKAMKGEDPNVKLELEPCKDNILLLHYQFVGDRTITVHLTVKETGCSKVNPTRICHIGWKGGRHGVVLNSQFFDQVLNINWKTLVQHPKCIQKVMTELKMNNIRQGTHELENAYLFLDFPFTMTNAFKNSNCTGGPFVIHVTVTDRQGKEFVSETILDPLALFDEQTKIETFNSNDYIVVYWKQKQSPIGERNLLTKCLTEARLLINGKTIQAIDVGKEGVFRIGYNTFCSSKTFTVKYIFGSEENTKEKKFTAKSKLNCDQQIIDPNQGNKTVTQYPTSDIAVHNKTKADPKKKKPFLDKKTILAVSIGLPMGLTTASISICLLAICVKKCREKLGETEETGDYAGDLNEDYGIYYTSEHPSLEGAASLWV